MNNLALTLAKEEPEIVTLAIRPGVVDTEMQASMAKLHHGKMDQGDAARFREMKSEGKFLRPEQPGNVMARLALGGPKGLNGMFLRYVLLPSKRNDVRLTTYSWDDKELNEYQES